MGQGEGGGPKPRVMTEAECKEIETLAAVLSQEQIADYLGIGRTTFYEIRKRQPEVSEHYARGRARAIGSLGQGLLIDARGGDARSREFYLRTQGGWTEKQAIDHTSSDGSMSSIPANASPETLRQVRELLYGSDANED